MPNKQQILVRTPESTHFSLANTTDKAVETSSGSELPKNASSLVWSSDAQYYASLAGNKVTICSAKADTKEGELEIPGLHALHFSPQANFIITFQKPSKESGNADKNLKLWDWRTREIKLQLFQKSFSRDAWPSLQLTHNEDLAFQQITNCVNAYSVQDATVGVTKKLNLKGVAAFGISPEASKPMLAAFVPEGKGQPGYVGLWNIQELDKSANSIPPFSRRSFFRATSARLLWNAKGSALLALTASETDSSNKSYYGEQKLHYLAANGALDCLVPLPKEGPVHDVQWSPSGDHFVTVSGFMPSRTNLFNAKCKMLHDLGAGPYNLVRWNPQGRFLAVAGFGNLPGDIGFHDRQGDTCSPLGAAKAEDGVSMDWSPDGRMLLTATTAPRMRVNNGIQIFRYTGDLIHEQKYPVLLEASWKPAPPGLFEDRPASPKKGAAAKSGASAAPIRAAGYVPPHVRSSGGAAPSGGHFSLSSEQKASSKLGGARGRTLVPGAEAPEAQSSKPSARKRGKGKSKGLDGNEEKLPSADTLAPEGNGHTVTGVKEGVQNLAIQSPSDGSSQDTGKRIRNLKKKLTQIKQLRERKESGASLEPEQESKIESEPSIVEELQSLGEIV